MNLIDDDTIAVLIELIEDWEAIAARPVADNWKRSPLAREDRRESKVYGNCASALKGAIGRSKVREIKEKMERSP